jgi:hypothetical protein
MSVITDITKNVDARPLYAVVGATDLTVEKAREAAGTVEAFGTQLRADFDKLVADLAPAKVQDRTLAAFAQVQELPTTVAAESKANADKLVARYEDLAERGQKLVARIRNQKATKDLVAQAETTVAQAKGAVTTARKEAVKAAEAIVDSVNDEVKVVEAEVTTAAKRTRTAAKRTSTTTRNAAKKTTASAKGARTSAKKTAAATAKATEKAAAKVGD